jgi:hypothetical protein
MVRGEGPEEEEGRCARGEEEKETEAEAEAGGRAAMLERGSEVRVSSEHHRMKAAAPLGASLSKMAGSQKRLWGDWASTGWSGRKGQGGAVAGRGGAAEREAWSRKSAAGSGAMAARGRMRET